MLSWRLNRNGSSHAHSSPARPRHGALGLFRRASFPAADHRQRRARHDLVGVWRTRADARPAARRSAGASRHSRQGHAPARTPHLHRPDRRQGRQARAGAAGRHRGDRRVLRLGLQLRASTRRRPAGRFSRDPQHPHRSRPRAQELAAAMGPRGSGRAVLRRDGHRAAAGVGHDLDGAAAPERRQPRQQGACRRHHALSADLRRGRVVLGRRRPRCATTCAWNGPWPRLPPI